MMRKRFPVACALFAGSTIALAAPYQGDAPGQATWAATVASGEPLLLAGLLPQDGEAGYELAFWNSIKDSTNAADYEAYLQAYPNGRFAPLAKSRLERYRKTAAPPPAPPAAAPSITITVMDADYQANTATNVRDQPSAEAEKVGELAAGERVHVTGKVRERDWFRIRLAGGDEGYVFAPLLEQAKPVTPPTPKPTPASEPKPAPASTPKPAPAPAVTAKPAPVAPPAPVASGKTFSDCAACPEMVTLPAGSFLMGSERGDRSEQPAHKVTIGAPFAIGKYEVTVAQWKACVGDGGCSHISDKIAASEQAPISDISWDDAQQYVRWLSKTTGRPYRLPTEAEWEYAARAGTTTRYWWGEAMSPGKAYCKDCGEPWNRDQPADVGSRAANPFGLYDTSGNVWEWVADCSHKDYHGAPGDGSAWDERDCRERVIRGGSWRDGSTYMHSASRFYYDAYVRYLLNGFRVAASVK